MAKNIRQALNEVRKAIERGAEISSDQVEYLEQLKSHKNHGVRRQAYRLLSKASEYYWSLLLAGELNALAY